MTAGGPVRVEIDVELDAEADAVELDEQTTLLRQELVELDIDRVERKSGGEPPSGTRAVDVAALGSLIVELGPSALGPLLHAVHAWLRRSRARMIRVKLGEDELVIEHASEDAQRELIDAFVARQGRSR